MKKSKKDAGKCKRCGHRRSWWINCRPVPLYRVDGGLYLCKFCNQAGCQVHGDLTLVWCAECTRTRLCPECARVAMKGPYKIYLCDGCYYKRAEEALST